VDDRPGALSLELECALDCPPDEAFRLLTVAEEVAHWWGPVRFTAPEVRIDLREGGVYRILMQPPEGKPFHLFGEFLEIERPRRLSYTFVYETPDPDDRPTTVTLVLDAVEGGTMVRLSQTGFATDARVALHRDGWTDSFARLRERVERVG